MRIYVIYFRNLNTIFTVKLSEQREIEIGVDECNTSFKTAYLLKNKIDEKRFVGKNVS